jgi:putative RecB family exonuclease
MLSISATKLTSYARCPNQYYLRYHKKVGSIPMRSAFLGKALHLALAEFHQWPEWKEKPSIDNLDDIWKYCCLKEGLGANELQTGSEYLQKYYVRFIANQDWRVPIACEGKLDGSLYVHGISFKITGRFDRLDSLPTGGNNTALHLIDYKLGRTIINPEILEMDLQMGLMQIALDQKYQQALKQISHIYLRIGEILSFEAKPEQRTLAQERIEELALRLMADQAFEAKPGEHCSSCACKKYCHAIVKNPEQLDKAVVVQLSLC